MSAREDQVRFFGKVAALIEAGVPPLEAFRMGSRGVRDAGLSAAIDRILDRARQGTSITEAFNAEDEHFSAEVLTLLELGEGAGDLEKKARVISEELRSGVFEVGAPGGGAKEDSLPRLIEEAIRSGATDLYFEPVVDGARLRLRIDGFMKDHGRLTTGEIESLLASVRRRGGLSTTDAIFGFTVAGERVTARFCRYEHGEGLLLSLAPSIATGSTLENIGLGAEDARRIRGWLATGDGVVIVTGPRGSGKTTTLAAMLREIDVDRLKVTALDPSGEIQVRGVARVAPRPDILGAFEAQIAQDPDVVYLAEVSSAEMAKRALAAAGSGRLVLTPLHAWGAPEALARLVKIGIDADTVAETVRGIVGQRLLRPAAAEGEAAPPGRVPVYEVMELTSALWRALRKDPSPGALRRAAVSDGLVSLGSAAVDLAEKGRLIGF